jgi:glycine/D-amino acid oxidase-like deaminating enzyme
MIHIRTLPRRMASQSRASDSANRLEADGHGERLRVLTELHDLPSRAIAAELTKRAVPGVDGAYVATGHSVWGMLNAPATGEAMSELILDGAARHVDLAPFAPGRLPSLDPARLRDLPEARVPSNRAPSGI